MRLLSLLLPSLLWVGGTLAKASSKTVDRFDAYHAKQRSSGPLKLPDTEAYNKLTAQPRDYSVTVLLTAMDARFGCQLCREFQPEFDLVARSWARGDKPGASRMLFGQLDFNDGRDVFVSLGLQTAPVLLFFPPTIGPHATNSPEPLRYDFNNGPSAEILHAWYSRLLPGRPHPPIRRPINWFAWATNTTMVLGALTAVFVAWPYALPIIQNRNVWAGISLISILLFTSGHMFNHIRHVPYVAGDGRGGISYFANGFQTQYGMETQLVAGMYGILSFATIALAIKVPRVADDKLQKAAVFIWAGIIFFMFSYLLSVFRMKNGGYPFSLPPFM